MSTNLKKVKISRIFARLFSRVKNENQDVLNFLLPEIDIVNNSKSSIFVIK